MFKKRTTDEYFNIIKKNHKKYLEAHMVTYLGIAGTENKKSLIDRYLSYIKSYRALEKNDLDEAIKGPSAAEKAGRGAFSALLGMGIGGLIFAGEQRVPSADLMGAKTAVQGGFSAVIGASCAALIYKAWDTSSEKPAHADFKACEEEMKKAGFTSEKYAGLSEDLVKLFYFRECLLLGHEDKSKISMRTAFKNKYYSSKNTDIFDDQDFNLSIEVYFLEQLNELFTQSFQSIYQTHDKEIQDEKQEPSFIRWFHRHFGSSKNQQQFTQQMQVTFINECIHFLEKEMSQPSFMGQYLFLFDFLAGLITGSIAVGVSALTILFIPVFALISIAIVSASLAAISAHLIITRTDSLYYQRDKGNREGIHTAIQSITNEQKRLSTSLQQVVVTTGRDLTALKKYEENNDSSFLKFFRGEDQKRIALGSVRGWIREFASRFNESKAIEIDLSERVKTMISDAHDQTESLQTALHTLMSSTPHVPSTLERMESSITHTPSASEILTQFITDTKDYLKHPENAAFIKTFEAVQKIKEQVLEIVGNVPHTQPDKALPDALINFYKTSVSEGGLGGLMSDLDQVRRLAPVVTNHLAADATHPYHCFLELAFAIHLKLNASPHAEFILQGDSLYRKMLGFPPEHDVRIEDKINAANIQDYLNQSFDFLCSLNQYETNVNWDTPFQNHDQFILYRMLFVKQLANLIDPNNTHVDKLVVDDIKAFVRLKLNSNPDIAFDDILHQALLITSETDDETINDRLGNPRSLTALSYIADAVRVNIAYMSTSLSPQKLINFEASHFLNKGSDRTILGYNASGNLIPEFSDHFYRKIQETIATTTAFMATIKTHSLLQQTGTVRIYTQVVLNEIAGINQQITVLMSLPIDPSVPFNRQSLQASILALDAFKNTLTASIPVVVPLVAPSIAPNVIIEPAAITPAPAPHQPAPELQSVHHEITQALTTVIAVTQEILHAPEQLLEVVTHLLNPNHHAVVSDASLIAPPNDSTHLTQPLLAQIQPLTSTVHQLFIQDLDTFILRQEAKQTQEQKPSSFPFFCRKQILPDQLGPYHHHSRSAKLSAARTLRAALDKLNKGEQLEKPHDFSNELYVTNKHLHDIIIKHGHQNLNSLFSASTAAISAL